MTLIDTSVSSRPGAPTSAPGSAAKTAAQAAAGPVIVHAVVVDVDGGMVVVEAGGRILGLDGLAGAKPGTHLALALPAGFPGLGSTVEARLPDSDAPAVLSARLLAAPSTLRPVTLSRMSDGKACQAFVVNAGPGPGPGSGSGSGADADAPTGWPAEVVPREPVRSSAGRADGVVLRTPLGDFLAPSGTPGVAGHKLTLLFAEATTPPDAAKAVFLRTTGDTAVALAALVARASPPSAARAEARHVDRRAEAADAGRAAVVDRERPVGAPTCWEHLGERLAFAGQDIDVLVECVDPGQRDEPVQWLRALMLAFSLTRIGDVQLHLLVDGDSADLAVRTALPLDPASLAYLHAVLRDTAATGRSRLRGSVVVGLLGLPERRGRAPMLTRMA